jgi:hypothetical protein
MQPAHFASGARFEDGSAPNLPEDRKNLAQSHIRGRQRFLGVGRTAQHLIDNEIDQICQIKGKPPSYQNGGCS